jgi:hypothetical protein
MPPKSGITEGRVAIKKGKLLKIWARFNEDVILDIKITGDFFVYPENTIELIENSLLGKRVSEVGEIIKKIMENCEYIGIEPQDIYEAVRLAWMKRS